MSIKIIKAGVQTTLQDAGRHGHRNIGVGSSGAMDIFAMMVANYLCGNDDGAVMELNFPAPEILFLQDAVISIAGADFEATINDMSIPAWRTILIKKDSVLKCKQPLSGAKLYLAVHGGWHAQQWLNSYSTHLKLVIGGYSGRALKKDDVVGYPHCNYSFAANKILPWHISANELDNIYQQQNSIRCLAGPEYDWLDKTSKENLQRNTFTIANQSDRMGYRLQGNTLSIQQTAELISSAVDAGTVQLLPDGNCIIMMADHQTTGGYPRIASVIKADLPKLAQLNSGKTICFKIININEAEDALISMHKMLAAIKHACYHNLQKYLPH